MKRRVLGGALIVTLAATTTSPATHAQGSYRCVVDGRMVLSDRPCPGASTQLRMVGPTHREPMVSRPLTLPSAGPAQDHLKYLNPDCAELSEAIRTAPARGVGSATVSGLHREYRAKCSEEDRLARQQLSEAQSDQRKAERAARDAKVQARVQTQREAEQCHEMLRVLHGRRQRASQMTPGELADLQRFEEAYATRCKG